MLARFAELWSPKRIARLNNYDFRIVKVQGEFTWHTHDDTDEFFLVLGGQLTIQLRDRDVVLRPRELFVVPRGTEHCPRADTETALLLFEPSDVVNTGDACGELTAEVEPLALPPGESPVTPPGAYRPAVPEDYGRPAGRRGAALVSLRT